MVMDKGQKNSLILVSHQHISHPCISFSSSAGLITFVGLNWSGVEFSAVLTKKSMALYKWYLTRNEEKVKDELQFSVSFAWTIVLCQGQLQLGGK